MVDKQGQLLRPSGGSKPPKTFDRSSNLSHSGPHTFVLLNLGGSLGLEHLEVYPDSKPTNMMSHPGVPSGSPKHSRPSHHGLNTGAIVGITLGSVVAVLLLCGIPFYVLRNRRQQFTLPLCKLSINSIKGTSLLTVYSPN